LWTIVPVRGIAEGKSRLAGVLDAAARAELNRRLLASTLAAIGKWRGNLAHCVVVTPCRATRGIAAQHGAAVVDEGESAAGLNEAAALGASYARRNGARRLLVLACDLPHLSAEALAAMCDAAAPQRQMVVASDRRGSGTNALLVKADEPFEFRFGEGSLARHLALAAERGWCPAFCARPELEFDLDTPEDLARWTAVSTSRKQFLPLQGEG
jgi:2-phospho-L-lactate guanylyltransferase